MDSHAPPGAPSKLLSKASGDHVVVIPPDSIILVDYLRLKSVLQLQVQQACGAGFTSALFQQLLALLENQTHMEYSNDSHLVKAAMLPVKPFITDIEQRVLSSHTAGTSALSEQQLLEAVTDLLLQARYRPLTRREWDIARKHQFTFDIPVQIEWKVLDDKMLARFWKRQSRVARHSAQVAHNSTPSSSSSSRGSGVDSHNISNGNSKTAQTGSPEQSMQQNGNSANSRTSTIKQLASGQTSSSMALRQQLLKQQQQQRRQELLDRRQLPDFFDRLLVFHRGVGVATCDGLYLDKKIDLLLAYLLVEPIGAWLNHIKSAVTPSKSDDSAVAATKTAAAAAATAATATAAATAASGVGANAANPSALANAQAALTTITTAFIQATRRAATVMGGQDSSKEDGEGSHDAAAADSAPLADHNRTAAPAVQESNSAGSPADGAAVNTNGNTTELPFASADLAHPYARAVARRSLRSLMPGPREVIQQITKRMVLQEPTFRDVVVIYRAVGHTQSEVSASVTQAAEVAVAAALYAGTGAAAMAADAVIEATQHASKVAAHNGNGNGKKGESSGERNSETPSSDSKVAGSSSSTMKTLDDLDKQPRQSSKPHASASGAKGGTYADTEADQKEHEERQLSQRLGLLPGGQAIPNPSNICIKSFCEVAMADLELVFPSKKAEVLPTTLVRSALTAIGALGAAAAWVQQVSDLHWSLPVLLSAGVVAGRAIRVLSTIKGHQAGLNSMMMKMQYDAACDSQEGVLIKLVDELREQHLKEVALAAGVMLLMQQQQQQQDGSENSGSGGKKQQQQQVYACSIEQIDGACEFFLRQKFGLQVDFVVSDAIARMQRLGLVQEVTEDQYSLVPLQIAINTLQDLWKQHADNQLASKGASAPAGKAGRWTFRQAAALRNRFNSISGSSISSSSGEDEDYWQATAEPAVGPVLQPQGPRPTAAGSVSRQLTKPWCLSSRHVLHTTHTGNKLAQLQRHALVPCRAPW